MRRNLNLHFIAGGNVKLYTAVENSLVGLQ